MKRWFLGVLIPVILISAPAQAQSTANIEVDSSNKALNISGWLEEDNTLTGNLRLTARSGNVENFIFLPSELHSREGDGVINPQQITLEGSPSLSSGVPKDFQVKISNIHLPGVYEGRIKLLLSNQAQSQIVPLKVVAKTRPNLTPLPDASQVQLNLVNCSGSLGALDCLLGHFLLPGSFQRKWELHFDNLTQAPVNLVDTQVVVRGRQSGYQLTETELTPPQEKQVLPANQIVTIPLIIDQSAIPPDQYVGTLHFTLEGQSQRLTAPVDLKVRSGPLLPLILLLSGIVLGRLFKYMQERGTPITTAKKAVNQLKYRIQQEATNPDEQASLLSMADEIDRLIYQEKLEKAPVQLEAVEAKLEAILKLQQLEEKLPLVEGETDLDKKIQNVKDEIERTRKLLLLKQVDVDVKERLDKILEGVTSLIDQGLMGDDTNEGTSTKAAQVIDLGEALKNDILHASTVSSTTQVASHYTKSIWLVRLKNWFVIVSGVSDQIRTEATVWILRPILSLTLLIGLSIVGLNSIYIDNGATFGSQPLSDYFSLIFWGLSADVASRKLSNLQDINTENTTNS